MTVITELKRFNLCLFYSQLDRFVIDDLKSALSLDGLTNSHPIKVPVYHPDEIWQMFDSISYSKVLVLPGAPKYINLSNL